MDPRHLRPRGSGHDRARRRVLERPDSCRRLRRRRSWRLVERRCRSFRALYHRVPLIPRFGVVTPDSSPDAFLTEDSLCHLVVCRRSPIEELGGFRPDFGGGPDGHRLLRIRVLTDRIGHIPQVLLHRCAAPGTAAARIDAGPYAREGSKRRWRKQSAGGGPLRMSWTARRSGLSASWVEVSSFVDDPTSRRPGFSGQKNAPAGPGHIVAHGCAQTASAFSSDCSSFRCFIRSHTAAAMKYTPSRKTGTGHHS